MFKKDDYIVCLEGDFKIGNESSEVAAINFVIKQDKDEKYLAPTIGATGICNRSNHDYTFDKQRKLKDWRYATKEEKAEYDRIGKPYDVTTLKTILTKEEYFYSEFGGETWIFKVSDIKSNDIYVHTYINEGNFINHGGRNFGYVDSQINFRKATQEEIDWLDACIAQNKFVSLEDSLKYNHYCPFKIGDKVFLEKHYKADEENQDYSKDIPLNTELTISHLNFKEKVYGNTTAKWCVYFKNYSFGHPIEKFKPISEMKTNYDSILEEAKKRYPIGTKFYPAHLSQREQYSIITNDTVFKTDKKYIRAYIGINDCAPNNDSKYGNSSWVRCLYDNGKWAEIIEEVKEDPLIPEYIEATKNYNDYFLKGIIYKVLDNSCYTISTPVQTNIEIEKYGFGSTFYVDLTRGNYKNSNKESYEAQVKSKFIVGRWYCLFNNFYFKFKEKIGDKLYYSENINSKIHTVLYDWCGEIKGNRLATQEELNKYLPEGHPDRTNKQEWIPKVDDWVVITYHTKEDSYSKDQTFIAQLSRYNSVNDYWVKNVSNVKGRWKDYDDLCCDGAEFRKAEPHEIPKSNFEDLLSWVDPEACGELIYTPTSNEYPKLLNLDFSLSEMIKIMKDSIEPISYSKKQNKKTITTIPEEKIVQFNKKSKKSNSIKCLTTK